jgi:hypothetical protein
MIKKIIQKNTKEFTLSIAIAFAFILFSISIYSLYNHIKCINDLEKSYKLTEKITLNSLEKRKKRHDFLKKYQKSNSNHLINFFTNYDLQTEEKRKLTYLSKQPFFYESGELLEEINKLSENKFEFLIGKPIEKKNIKEFLILLKKPVFFSYNDLEKTLSLIENNTNQINRSPQHLPYYIFIEFCKYNCKFDCKILQREFK